MHLLDIPSEHVPALASILQFRPDEDLQERAKRISKNAKALPALLRPGRLERLLLPPLGHLCKMHKNLDYSVVEVVLHHIQIEVGERLNNLIWSSQLLTREQFGRVTRLRSLHALWLAPAEYEMTFLASTRDLKWQYQQDLCEACIVSHITGDLEALLDLRYAIQSRATSKFLAKHGNPRLQLWVHAWIDALLDHLTSKTGQDVDVDAIIAQNEMEARELMRLRMKIHALRKKTLVDLPGPDGDKDGEKHIHLGGVLEDADHLDEADGAELDVVDAYAALNSPPCLPAVPQRHSQSQSRNAADSNSVSADPSRKGQSPYQHPHPMPAQESFYSVDTVANNAGRVAASVLKDITECPEDKDEVYMPPRQLWKKQSPPSSASLWAKKTLPPIPTVGFIESWETVPVNSSYTIHTVPTEPPLEGQQRHRERCPADTYVNLIDLAALKSDPLLATADTWTSFGDYVCYYTHESQSQDASRFEGEPINGDSPTSSHESESESTGRELAVQRPYEHALVRSSPSCEHSNSQPPNLPQLGDEVKNTAASSTTISSWGGMYGDGVAHKKDLSWFYTEVK
ncbi:hypothetical protein A1O3_04242 [Capronia epimyces CBS 606.96]|uniref:Uncharacterized protein n=1 Tax=Capronia epimyces CBS 606.96 TaxID=1182542 RepID=W9Y444_9EURO|nr:uncharacterized protein A1O3_04242 [Capronia epimyces CBS 606.96]EXJ87283.1 hypothetical protein A1O3_04242 [Capronia epimyces CBS 606.96]